MAHLSPFPFREKNPAAFIASCLLASTASRPLLFLFFAARPFQHWAERQRGKG